VAVVYDYEDPKIEIDTETCQYCTGISSVLKKDNTHMTSKEYCEAVNTCAATIDWDKVYGRD